VIEKVPRLRHFAARYLDEARPRAIKNLRGTVASQLLTAGIQLGYVSQQLGHANASVTARRHTRWCGGDQYREPLARVDCEATLRDAAQRAGFALIGEPIYARYNAPFVPWFLRRNEVLFEVRE